MNCHECVHHRHLPGDAHLRCNNVKAKVVTSFATWPYNFNPNFVERCDGFSVDKKDQKEEDVTNPIEGMAKAFLANGGRLI